MIIFGTGSTLSAIFVVFVLDETAGKSLDDVELNMAADNQRNSISKSWWFLYYSKTIKYYVFDIQRKKVS